MRQLLPFKVALQPIKVVKAVWYKSWTRALGWFTAVPSATLATASTVNTYISDPTFKSYLSVIDVPKTVTVAFAILGLLIWLAHGRENDA